MNMTPQMKVEVLATIWIFYSYGLITSVHPTQTWGTYYSQLGKQASQAYYKASY